MAMRVWSTREACARDFGDAWKARLAGSPLAHYAMRLDLLEWQARHGEHALALLVDDPLPGAIVLRETRLGWACGWPWRWQALVEGDETLAGLSTEQAGALASAAERAVPGKRLEFFAPEASAAGWPGFKAGTTVMLPLTEPEESLWKRLDKTKQSSIKRATRDGFSVAVADRPEQFRAFRRLQLETDARRDGGEAAPEEASPAPGEAWREWELPWQWLLVAERDGVVEAGSGFGVGEGGTIDYRTNASSIAGKKSGCNFMLAWEAIRRGRERGCRRMNWGGATRFKRDMGGEMVPIWCGLGGGAAWRLPNEVSASIRRARPRVAAWWRKLRETPEGKTR